MTRRAATMACVRLKIDNQNCGGMREVQLQLVCKHKRLRRGLVGMAGVPEHSEQAPLLQGTRPGVRADASHAGPSRAADRPQRSCRAHYLELSKCQVLGRGCSFCMRCVVFSHGIVTTDILACVSHFERAKVRYVTRMLRYPSSLSPKPEVSVSGRCPGFLFLATRSRSNPR